MDKSSLNLSCFRGFGKVIKKKQNGLQIESTTYYCYKKEKKEESGDTKMSKGEAFVSPLNCFPIELAEKTENTYVVSSLYKRKSYFPERINKGIKKTKRREVIQNDTKYDGFEYIRLSKDDRANLEKKKEHVANFIRAKLENHLIRLNRLKFTKKEREVKEIGRISKNLAYYWKLTQISPQVNVFLKRQSTLCSIAKIKVIYEERL